MLHCDCASMLFVWSYMRAMEATKANVLPLLLLYRFYVKCSAYPFDMLCDIIVIIQAPKGAVGKAVIAAIEAGYRMIDTANDYGNEKVKLYSVQHV